jgi:hypothetical protein
MKLALLNPYSLKRIFLLTFIYGIALSAFGQQGLETMAFGPRAFASGHISGLFRDVWAAQNNPGALGFLPGNALAVSYERRFSSLSLTSFSAVLKHDRFGSFGLAASRFGPDFFNKTRAGLSWGKAFGIASLGVQAQWYQVFSKDQTSRHYFLLHAGGMARLGEKLLFSGSISNLTQTKASDYSNQLLPVVMKAGLAFQPNSSLNLLVEVQKGLDDKAGIGAAIEYHASKAITVRSGFNSANRNAGLGFGLRWRDFQLDAGSNWHLELGFSHCIGMQYLIGKQTSHLKAN